MWVFSKESFWVLVWFCLLLLEIIVFLLCMCQLEQSCGQVIRQTLQPVELGGAIPTTHGRSGKIGTCLNVIVYACWIEYLFTNRILLKTVGEQVSSLLSFFTFFKESAQKSSVFVSLGELGINCALYYTCLLNGRFIFNVDCSLKTAAIEKLICIKKSYKTYSKWSSCNSPSNTVVIQLMQPVVVGFHLCLIISPKLNKEVRCYWRSAP